MNFQELLDKWNIKCSITTILGMWNEPHRSYHTKTHLTDLVNQIFSNKLSFTEKEYEMLLITALFHDCVYDPSKNDNEEKSAEFFMECCGDKSNPDILKINQMILDTKSHNLENVYKHPCPRLSHIFIEFDMIIIDRSFKDLLKWEEGIAKEYIPVYGKENYKKGRLKFLESLLDKHPGNIDNLMKLIEWVKNNY